MQDLVLNENWLLLSIVPKLNKQLNFISTESLAKLTIDFQ